MVNLQRKPVAIKARIQMRRVLKGARIGNLGKGNSRFAQCWIGLPQTLVIAKIGQAGIDSHACVCGNDEGIGLFNQACGLVQGMINVLHEMEALQRKFRRFELC